MIPDNAFSCFEYHEPTKIIFGEGSINSIDKQINFADNILVVCEKQSAILSGGLEKLKRALKKYHLTIYNEISPNPKTVEINKGAEVGRSVKVEAVIGIGGGSSIDAAKAIAASIPKGENVENLLRNGISAPTSTLPIIAIPTTAGTGSEVSMGAIITDTNEKRKRGLRGTALFPKLAIIDPELTYSVPHHITAETGFDILTHAIETMISKKANAITNIFSEYSIKTVIEYLPRVLNNEQDKEARRNLMLASTLAGINLANSSTCLPHRLQYPLGAHTDCSHARGLIHFV